MRLLTFLVILFPFLLFGQTARVQGRISDPQNKPIEGVEIEVLKYSIFATSDSFGKYSVTIPVSKPTKVQLKFKHFVHDSTVLELEIRNGYDYDKPIKMEALKTGNVNIVTNKKPIPQMMVIPIRPEEVAKIPTVNPSVESVVLTMPGVVGTSEFSSQYKVRGGNFDENLVYVNGIEIYRPFLVRSGQMEGLGFANRSMTDNIAFSTGGFPAQYGDKLSSVLDITYRQPKSFKGSAELGIITNTLHLEGISKNKKNPEELGKFTYLLGARYFTLGYLLNSLETKGNYKPAFGDLQGMFTYVPKRYTPQAMYITRKDGTKDTLYNSVEKWKFTGFFVGNRNKYLFIPKEGEATFGSIQSAYRLQTAFEGQEAVTYSTVLGSLMAEHRPNSRWKMQHILSAFRTQEAEIFDVEGGYRLSELNTNFGSEGFGEESAALGTGSVYHYARNFLKMNVIAAETKGEWIDGNNYKRKIFWGVKGEMHFIQDALKEYSLFDSAQYVSNQNQDFDVIEYLKGSITIQRQLIRAYYQEEVNFGRNKAASLTYGLRYTYDNYIKQGMTSPRVQFIYDFSKRNPNHQVRLRLASGVYHQPPIYREFRQHDGTLQPNLTPQTSIHFIAGTDYTFKAWGRPFKLFSEAYYKYLYNIIPYEVQNVRIRYYPSYQLPGYAYGLDARVNGEFIKGLESWISASYLKTSERLSDTINKYISRPTDQRFTFSMYFQDELPMNPTYKAHINYVYGSGSRFGYPFNFEERTVYRFPSYHRVDIGFSKMIIFRTAEQMEVRKHGIASLWATAEIFNLFGRYNTVGYEWVRDINNRYWSVPQHLSARLINVRMIVQFK